MTTLLDRLSESAWKRLRAAWSDPEITITDLRTIHHISGKMAVQLAALWGPKAKIGPLSHGAISYAKKQARLRAKRRANVCVPAEDPR